MTSYRKLREELDNLITQMVQYANDHPELSYKDIGRIADADSETIRYWCVHRGGNKRQVGRKKRKP